MSPHKQQVDVDCVNWLAECQVPFAIVFTKVRSQLDSNWFVIIFCVCSKLERGTIIVSVQSKKE